MNNRYRLLLLLLALLAVGCEAPQEPLQRIDVSEALGGGDSAGFARADRVRPFSFPDDHSAHPDFRNEWWYLTGNLENSAGDRFGFQVTLFRIALTPGEPDQSRSAWATNQIWMAHAALTDVTAGDHWAEERLVRGALGLAGVNSSPLSVWVEDWVIAGGKSDFPRELRVKTETFTLNLDLQPLKSPLLQGDQGLSQKSGEPGNASYYYSIPRLRAEGEIRVEDRNQQVSGLAWLDREWSTSALSDRQRGWDWFSLQFFDGMDLMFYRLRRRDGSRDPHSAGSISAGNGEVTRLDAGDMELDPTRWWRSPEGIRYPLEWDMWVVPLQRRFQIRPILDDQEMALSVRYWEGAVEILEQGRPVGRGYLELAGYD